jgi:hypothetical protein
MRRRPGTLTATLFLGGFLLVSPSAQGGDVTIFIAKSRPSDNWGDGYGAALSTTWFKYATAEAEVARLPGQGPESGMTSFTGSAMLSVPLKALTPYGGFGVGIFRQTVPDNSDIGTLKAFLLGLKIHLGGLIVIRGDYRRLDLSGPPAIDIDDRLAVGLGVSF